MQSYVEMQLIWCFDIKCIEAPLCRNTMEQARQVFPTGVIIVEVVSKS